MKEKLIDLLKSIKNRMGLTNSEMSKLLGMEHETFINMMYHDTMSSETALHVVKNLRQLVKKHIIELTIDEIKDFN